MDIKTLSSGSAGNCYLIEDGHTQLLLECGLTFKNIQKALKFKTSKIKACLVTHRHLDHSKGLKGVLDKAITTYISHAEKEALGVQHNLLKGIEPLEQFRVGTWRILPFDVQHDTEGPLGYLLQSDTGEKLLFATDTYYIKYRFQGITHMLIECNYSKAIIEQNVEEGTVHESLERRVMKSHMSLENLIVFLKACDLSSLQEIRLIHLSDTNSDEAYFKDRIQRVIGVPVYIED